MSEPAPPLKRKLIEVALPLEAINRESIREKSIRQGHPSTLHLWWSRKPLSTARAVLFAQLVDDPSAHPDRFPTDEDQRQERRRLFDLIERLVVWENTGDERLLREAHNEIARCFGGHPPAILDPFAGGGSIPLEGQRLGLKVEASDLNPVAVLINKALVEIPPRWSGRPPVFPEAAASRIGGWANVTGLAEDVRRYARWMRDEAERRIGHLYPPVTLPNGAKADVIAWVWARTVKCPNPACGVAMPLASKLWLSKKAGDPVWLRPIINTKDIAFEVVSSSQGPAADGTVDRLGATCIACATPVSLAYIRLEGQAGRIGHSLLATVAESNGHRVYLAASDDQVAAAGVARPDDVPEAELPEKALSFRVQVYGMKHWSDLFTNRQLAALTTLSDLVQEARSAVESDALKSLGSAGEAAAYADAVATYLGLSVGRLSDIANSLCRWETTKTQVRNLFGRQAVPMIWDFAETMPFGEAAGGFLVSVTSLSKVLDRLQPGEEATVTQADAASRVYDGAVVSTDPPYYDNIGYADLSDFFYVWLRRSLREIYPDLFGTLLTPKREELVATPFRFGGSRAKANEHFETGLVRTFSRIRATHPPDIPITVYYAFKQAETDEEGVASTGWETMLRGLIEAGLSISATWPMRSELSNRPVASGTNALASSIVLACRPLAQTAQTTTRRGFIQALRDELPRALRELQQGSVAPVDLAQASVGPGMAVFTRYRSVLEADGSSMSIRTALALINQGLDEVLYEQEGDFDADTRFCLKWFTQFGWNESDSGTADTLSRATNTSVAGLERGGIFRARAGRARLVGLEEMAMPWDPGRDDRVSVWEVVMRVAKALDRRGGQEASRLLGLAGRRVDLDTAKELAYLLYSVCEKRGWTASAVVFNGLGTSWLDLAKSAAGAASQPGLLAQGSLDFDDGSEE